LIGERARLHPLRVQITPADSEAQRTMEAGGSATGHRMQPPQQMMQYENRLDPMFAAQQAAYSSFGLMGQQAPGEGRMTPAELELELQLRGSLLVQQQRRIVQLETELQKAWQQMEFMRVQLVSQRAQLQVPATKKAQSRYWTPEEHKRFLAALEKFGPKDVRSISEFVGTRTPTQVRTHAQKFYLKVQKEEEAAQRDASTGEGRATKRRRTRSSRMQLPKDLTRIPRRYGSTRAASVASESGDAAAVAPSSHSDAASVSSASSTATVGTATSATAPTTTAANGPPAVTTTPATGGAHSP